MKTLNAIFKTSILTLSNLSLVLLISLILYSMYTQNIKQMIFIVVLLIIGSFYEKYQSHHILPVMAFYSFNIVQEWFQILLDSILLYV